MRNVIKTAVLLAVGAAGFWAWTHLSQPAPLWTERRGQLEALLVADTVAADQASWHDWSARLFVPTSTLDAIGQQYVGTRFSTPLGSADGSGKYEGRFEFTLASLKVTGVDAWLQASLSVDIRFVPERAHQEWSNVSASVTARGMLIPQQRAGDNFQIRVVPTEIAPSLSWRQVRLGVEERSLLSEAIGSGAVLAFARALLLEVRLPDAPSLSTRIDADEAVKFEQGGGQTRVITKYPGKQITLPLPFDVAAPTAAGVWMIARQAGAPPLRWPEVKEADATEATIVEVRQRVTARLHEWPSPTQVTVDVSRATLESAVKTLLPAGTPIDLKITTDKADGDIGHIENVRSEYVDRASLKLRPNGAMFANGTVTVTPGEPSFKGQSLTVPLTADLTATAALKLHQRPSIVLLGDGIGVPFDAKGAAHATLDATLTGEARGLPEGRAAVLQPAIACKRIQIDITSDVNVAGSTHKIGVRRQQHVGGDRMEPSVLIDDQPVFAEYQSESEATRNKTAPSRVTYPAERLVFSFNPSQASIGSDGLKISASVSVSRDADPKDSAPYKKRLADIDAKRAALRTALKEAAPELPCADPEQTALIADDHEFGPTNDLVIFAQTFAAIVATGGNEAIEKTKQWIGDAIAHPEKPPTPPPSVGEAIANAAAKRAGVPSPQDVKDEVNKKIDTICGSCPKL